MEKVVFRNLDNRMLFELNSFHEMNVVPLVGDIIKTNKKDFRKATFRMNPENLGIWLDFVVVSRSYCTCFKEWELICSPTQETLLYLLKNVKTKK